MPPEPPSWRGPEQSASGYQAATIRSIAAVAGIDAALVMRYYGNKEGLFAAAAEFDLRLPDLRALPGRQVGAELVGHFLDRWEGDETLMALLRAAVTTEAARACRPSSGRSLCR
jgi:AcrR family transcriptional regulator